MSEETNLSDLLALNLHKFEDEMRNVVNKATKELSMEKTLKVCMAILTSFSSNPASKILSHMWHVAEHHNSTTSLLHNTVCQYCNMGTLCRH